uniref:Uncharacterized protein n=1 Tax=Arundo donax TaxID=35708 RepID=A0A0A9GCE5_ARUDO
MHNPLRTARRGIRRNPPRYRRIWTRRPACAPIWLLAGRCKAESGVELGRMRVGERGGRGGRRG